MIKTMNTLFRSIIISMCLLLAACSTLPETSHSDNYNFSEIKSYSLFPRESKFTELQRMSDFQRNRIELAIENQMEVQNFEYKELEKADVVVSYFLVGRSLTELKKYNRRVRACLGCSNKEQDALNKDIRTSMIILDVLDNTKKRSIFRGYSKVKIDQETTSDENQQEMVEAITGILSQFPPKS